MSDTLNIALRLALYIDLLLIFGLAAFGLYSLRREERSTGTVLPFRPLLAWGAAIGVVLSIASMWLMATIMSGETDFSAVQAHIWLMLTETDIGLAWAARLVALVMAILAALLNRKHPTASLFLVSICGAVALATLAWNGHGAMDEGNRRVWHFASDILHLWAAGGWLGALAAFGMLLVTLWPLNEHTCDAQSAGILSRSLAGFGKAGSTMVVIVSVTGIVNYLFIVGPTLTGATSSTYGQLLLIKLGLFASMLGFAALNRLHLSPLLEQAVQAGHPASALPALRRSVLLELSGALLILLVVAWLGTLSPEMEMALG